MPTTSGRDFFVFPPSHKLSPRVAEVYQCFKEGMTTSEVAVALGITEKRVSEICRNYGIKLKRKHRS